MFQEEQTTEAKPKPDMTQCEYCGAVIKDKPQARKMHLHACKAYKAHSAEPLPPTNNGDVPLTPERASKLWQAVTGGTLAMEVRDGQIVCRVSKSSFDKALPVLLDLL